MKGCMLFMSSELKRIYFAFDSDVANGEQCDFHVTPVILKKTFPEHHFNMHNNVKQDFIDYS